MTKITDQYSDAMGDIGGRQPDLFMYSFAPGSGSPQIVGVYLDPHGAQATALQTYDVTEACTLLSLNEGPFSPQAVGFRGVVVGGTIYRGWGGQNDGTIAADQTPGEGYEELSDGMPLFLGRVNSNQQGAMTIAGLPSVKISSDAEPVAVAAGHVDDSIIRNSPGKLLRALVTATTANAGAMQIFDNAAAGTGTIIGTLPQNAVLGMTYDFEMPASAGITVKGDANNPGVTISHSS